MFCRAGHSLWQLSVKNFKLFVAGKRLRQIILGSLCAIGMLILRIPYAPMIGALVGVTALIPMSVPGLLHFVGAFFDSDSQSF